MIRNTQTINIDGTVLKHDEVLKALTFNANDNFSNWVVRPLALLSAVGIGVAMFFASAFLILISLAMIPLLVITAWAFKKKVERDIANASPIVDTQYAEQDITADDTQAAR